MTFPNFIRSDIRPHGTDPKTFLLVLELAEQILLASPLARSLTTKGDELKFMARLEESVWAGLIWDNVDVATAVKVLIRSARGLYGFGHEHMAALMDGHETDGAV